MATYTDLPAGTYTLRIRAFLLESPDKYDERTIEIEVPHNFFFSSRAIWLYLLLIIAASITLMYFRQRQLARSALTAKPANSPEATENDKKEEQEVEK